MSEEPTVLFVDDEQIVLDSARKLLRKDPLRVAAARSATEGLQLLEQGGISVVLTDLRMPGIDGMELLAEVKRRWPSLPVVMVTGYATIGTAMQAMKLGAFDYVAKPFTRDELRGTVRRALHLAAEQAGAAGAAGAAADAGGGGADGEETEGGAGAAEGGDAGDPSRPGGGPEQGLRTLGRNSWIMLQKDGTVLLGVERAFVAAVGEIRDVDLPAAGEVLTQGAVCLQVFGADLTVHTVWSPLSGEVVEVNPRLADAPASVLADPYGDGWLLRLRPSRFEAERQVLGL